VPQKAAPCPEMLYEFLWGGNIGKVAPALAGYGELAPGAFHLFDEKCSRTEAGSLSRCHKARGASPDDDDVISAHLMRRYICEVAVLSAAGKGLAISYTTLHLPLPSSLKGISASLS
jgi:hypothetical protein